MAESRIENARYVYVTTTLSKAEMARLDAWIGAQDPKPTRSAAIRNLMLAELARQTAGETTTE